MIYGNWVAIRKVFAKHLPDDRPYTKLEAVFSVSLDFDSGNPASYSGYSKLWKWSRNKVKKFMDDLGISILKPETPEEIGLQKGKLKGHPKRHPQDNLDDEKGQPIFVYNKGLYDAMDNLKDEKGQPKDTPKDTTIDPIKIPDPTTIKKVTKKSKKKVTEIEKPEIVSQQVWDDFLTHRKNKKANVTQTVLNTFTKQAEIAGVSLEYAMTESINRGWTGFKAEWVNKNENKPVQNSNQERTYTVEG